MEATRPCRIVFVLVLLSFTNGEVIIREKCFGPHHLGTDYIECPANTRIKVHSHVYGKSCERTCHEGALPWKQDCPNPDSGTARSCDGKRRCEIAAMIYFDGGKCEGSYKCYELQYECIGMSTDASEMEPESNSQTALEVVISSQDDAMITCPSGQLFEVVSADAVYPFGCTIDGTHEIGRSCDGKAQCDIWQESRYFIRSPCNTSRDITLRYLCKAPETPVVFENEPGIFTVEICMSEAVVQNNHLSCVDGTELDITRAEFGRMNIGRCVRRDLGVMGCRKDVTGAISVACSGATDCDVSDLVLGLMQNPPCPADSASYLEVDYRCNNGDDQVTPDVPWPTAPSHILQPGGRTTDMCMPEDRFLSCEEGTKLTIIDADFGRMRSSACMEPRLGYGGCKRDITDEMAGMCNSRSACDVLPLLTKLYREELPCPDDLQMYIEVTHTCRTDPLAKHEWSYPYSEGETVELCHSHESVRCWGREEMVIIKASYGRMRAGKCINGGVGYFDCADDVTQFLGDECNGKQRCEVFAFRDRLRNPCEGAPYDWPYFEVTFQCRKPGTI